MTTRRHEYVGLMTLIAAVILVAAVCVATVGN